MITSVLEFGVLGPLSLTANGQAVALPGIRPRRLLACLVLHIGRPVSLATLVDAVWGVDPPQSAAESLQSHASRLRLRLGPGVLNWTSYGYRLDVDPANVDARRFEDLIGRARVATAPGDALLALDQALAMWRGEPYPDLAHHDPAVAEAARLAELRVLGQEERAANLLALERREEAVVELQSLTVAQPLRERPWQLLMLALHRSGRQAEALAVYQRYDAVLAEEGLEPSVSIKDLRTTILAAPESLRPSETATTGPAHGTGEPAANPAEAARLEDGFEPQVIVPPAQLPADLGEFTGRARQLAELDRLLDDGARTAGGRVALIVGTAGVGKTALALSWAHRAAHRFPDGQLYVDLRGHATGTPLRPIEALAHLLGGLGVDPGRVPVDQEQASALYRSILAGRRVLILLDNAGSAAQVRPLLPGSASCAVVVTSRSRLAGLTAREGAVPIRLDVLEPDEAATLLRSAVGRRAVDEPAAVDELARLCAHLPLALRVAAANLGASGQRSVASYVADLATAGDRLTLLQVDDDELAAVRPAFELSYTTLPAPATRLFRLLGIFPGPELSVGAAVAMTGETPAEVRRNFELLSSIHLVEACGPDRYRCHDLLRYYAGERARAEQSTHDHEVALSRLFDWYIAAVDAAAVMVYPHQVRLSIADSDRSPPVTFDSGERAMGWLESERRNLVATVVHGAERAATAEPAWLLADAMRGYLALRSHIVDWLTVAGAALAAAEREGSALGQAAARFSLALAYASLSQYPRAVEEHNAALALARAAHWQEGEEAIPTTIARVYWEQGRLDQAVEYFSRALVSSERRGRSAEAVSVRINLAGVLTELGRLREARDQLERALQSHRGAGNWHAHALALAGLGATCRQLGELSIAHTHLTRSLRLARRMGYRSLVGVILLRLADVLRDTGRAAPALEHAHDALALARDVHHLGGEASSLNVLGATQLALGDRRLAVDCHSRALAIARDLDDRYEETLALIGLAEADPAASVEHATLALQLSREAGYRIMQGSSLTTLAAARLADADLTRAREHARAALEIQRETGHRLGEARSLLILGETLRRGGEVEAATAHTRQGRAIFRAAGAVEPGVAVPGA